LYIGNSKWVHEMEWSGQKEFVAAATVPFHVDNKEAGLMKNYGSLTFLKVNRKKNRETEHMSIDICP